mmetsp:Transcript_18634/g.56282  ORF Transcript_18634/g.56282 Transcript_18634/m.56282 type:complete len:200 (+) Transcript_18634:933-1532(+)
MAAMARHCGGIACEAASAGGVCVRHHRPRHLRASTGGRQRVQAGGGGCAQHLPCPERQCASETQGGLHTGLVTAQLHSAGSGDDLDHFHAVGPASHHSSARGGACFVPARLRAQGGSAAWQGAAAPPLEADRAAFRGAHPGATYRPGPQELHADPPSGAHLAAGAGAATAHFIGYACSVCHPFPHAGDAAGAGLPGRGN